MMPVTRPPPASAASAHSPISPTRPPPNTSSMPAAARRGTKLRGSGPVAPSPPLRKRRNRRKAVGSSTSSLVFCRRSEPKDCRPAWRSLNSDRRQIQCEGWCGIVLRSAVIAVLLLAGAAAFLLRPGERTAVVSRQISGGQFPAERPPDVPSPLRPHPALTSSRSGRAGPPSSPAAPRRAPRLLFSTATRRWGW